MSSPNPPKLSEFRKLVREECHTLAQLKIYCEQMGWWQAAGELDRLLKMLPGLDARIDHEQSMAEAMLRG